MFRISVENGMASVYTPYNKEFIAKIKQIGGRKWNSDEKCWMVPESEIETVRGYMSEVYGETDQMDESERVTVKLSFQDEYTASKGPVTLFGKDIARAWGRDSGARVCDDVVLEEGTITSGGSCANWKTIIKEGAVLRVKGISKAMLEKEDLPSYITCEVIEDKEIDRLALMQEKEKLLARLAEIEKMLNA